MIAENKSRGTMVTSKNRTQQASPTWHNEGIEKGYMAKLAGICPRVISSSGRTVSFVVVKLAAALPAGPQQELLAHQLPFRLIRHG
jgi:hypothetical protein